MTELKTLGGVGSNGSVPGVEPVGDGSALSPSSSSPLENSMTPVYEATRFFLDKIIAVNSLKELRQEVDLTDEDAVAKSLEENWQFWAEHYITYSVAVVIGCLFLVSMPLIGCLICCCRNRGRCGGNIEPIEPKNAKCRRITCSGLLLVFSTVILVAVTSCFLCTKLVRNQTLPSGTMSVFLSGLETVDDYIDDTQIEIKRLNSHFFDPKVKELQDAVLTFAGDAQKEVGTVTGAEPLFSDLQQYVDDLPQLLENLNNLENTTLNLQTQARDLETTLNTLVSNFEEDFAACSLAQCSDGKKIMSNLDVTADYTGQNLDSIRSEIQSVLFGSDNISFTVQQGWVEYNGVFLLISEASNNTLEALFTDFEAYARTFDIYINDTVDKLDDFDVSATTEKVRDSVANEVDDIGYYSYIGLNFLSVLPLLLVSMLFLGILFGCCGDRPGDHAAFCNRGHGASSLTCGLATFFALSWLLMVCTTTLFLGGGLSYTELCRHLVYDESQEDLLVIDNVVTSYFNISGASARTIVVSCENDLAFYRAFEVPQHNPELNVSKILDPAVLDLDPVLGDLLSQDYSIDPVTMLNDATESHLDRIEITMQGINQELYKNMAMQNITSLDLLDTSQLFNQFANEVESGSPGEARLFRVYSQELSSIHNGLVQTMTTGMGQINVVITAIGAYDAWMNLTTFVPELEEAQDAITSDEIIMAVRATMAQISNDVITLVENVESQVGGTIGRCFQVYTAINSSIHSVCVEFLTPFNAFWFSLGCALFFLTLSIPVALTLITLLRKSVPYLSPDDLIGQPQLHRRSYGAESALINHSRAGGGILRPHNSISGSSVSSSRNSRQVTAAPNSNRYQNGNGPYAAWNNAFISEGDDPGYVDYQILRDHPHRLQPIRPTNQNFAVELSPMGPESHRPISPHMQMRPMPNAPMRPNGDAPRYPYRDAPTRPVPNYRSSIQPPPYIVYEEDYF